VNETLWSETERRPSILVSSPRQDRDLPKPLISVFFRSETETFIETLHISICAKATTLLTSSVRSLVL